MVIDEDFSSKMYRMLTDWTGKPAITYYENAKKNAVATKITDTAVESLKRSSARTIWRWSSAALWSRATCWPPT